MVLCMTFISSEGLFKLKSIYPTHHWSAAPQVPSGLLIGWECPSSLRIGWEGLSGLLIGWEAGREGAVWQWAGLLLLSAGDTRSNCH